MLVEILETLTYEKLVVHVHHVCWQTTELLSYAQIMREKEAERLSRLIEGIGKHYPRTKAFYFKTVYDNECSHARILSGADKEPLRFGLGMEFSGPNLNQLAKLPCRKSLTTLHVTELSSILGQNCKVMAGFECAREAFPSLKTVCISTRDSTGWPYTTAQDHHQYFVSSNAAMWNTIPEVHLNLKPRSWCEDSSRALQTWTQLRSLTITLPDVEIDYMSSYILGCFKGFAHFLPDNIVKVTITSPEYDINEQSWQNVVRQLADEVMGRFSSWTVKFHSVNIDHMQRISEAVVNKA